MHEKKHMRSSDDVIRGRRTRRGTIASLAHVKKKF